MHYGSFAHREDLAARMKLEYEGKDLTIALPSGKSIEEPTLRLLDNAHIEVDRIHSRACSASISGFPQITRAVFLKPSMIGMQVAYGAIPIGITGSDIVGEDDCEHVQICAELPYNRATFGTKMRVVIFTRNENDVRSVRDINPRAKFISEYPRLTRIFFEENGIKGAYVPECPGSAEALVVIGKYDYGVAITETGVSLQVNGLKEIATILESTTVLIANTGFLKIPGMRELVDHLGKTLQGPLTARGKVYLVMNASAASVADICRGLPSLKEPTVQLLHDPAFCSIAAVVPAIEVNALKMKLAALGASGFVELDPVSIA